MLVHALADMYNRRAAGSHFLMAFGSTIQALCHYRAKRDLKCIDRRFDARIQGIPMKIHEKRAVASQSCCKSKTAAKLCSATNPEKREEGPDRRQTVLNRRIGIDRRQQTKAESGYPGPDRRSSERRDDTGLERRRGPGRRLSDDRRSAEEGEMTAEQFEFVMAIETYKKVNKRMYPTWTEVLEVVEQLGYRKTTGRTVDMPNVPEPALSKVG
jgi:hypothetical protein